MPTISKLDANQVLQHAYDDANQRLRVDAEVTATIGEVECLIDQSNDSIKIGDGTNLITATTVGPDVGLDVNVIGGVVTGNFTSSGLSTGLSVSEITVTDVATAIPNIPLANRNGMSIRIWNPNDTSVVVYIGGAAVTAANGYPRMHGEEFQIDVKDNNAVKIYGICESGKSCKVRILEVA